MTFLKFALPLVMLAAGPFAKSQTPSAITPKEPLQPTAERTLGWNRAANLGLNLSFSSSQDVVGQTDGSSETYGTNLKSSFNHVTEDAEWRNTVTLLETITKSPAVPKFVKSNDDFRLESLYLYSIPSQPRIGPYARVEAATPLFKGEDVQATDQSYVIQDTAGTVVTGPFTAGTVRLTDPFRPLTTKESVGFFWKASEDENKKLLLRVGFGALQIRADGQYALSGKDPAGNIIVRELDDVSQAGLELGFSLKGRFDEKTSFEAGADSLTPFINNQLKSDNRSALRLTNVEGFAKLTSNITPWASFGYDYRMKLQPQLVDRVQSIHMMVLSINYNLF